MRSCAPGSENPDGSYALEVIAWTCLSLRIIFVYTNSASFVARAGYRIFDRISDYDAKREHGIIARRKAKNTTTWLHSNSKFKAWLGGHDPTSHLWISGKGIHA
jgi:hypothetical protein